MYKYLLSLVSITLGSLILSFSAAASRASETWTPTLEFSDQGSGNLELRRHPQSPTSCGIEMIEVGVKDPKTGKFEGQMALLRDTYDSSYPGIAPKVRRIYSYNMPVSLKPEGQFPYYMKSKTPITPIMPVPSLIVDTDELKTHIIEKLLYGLTRTVVTSLGNPIASGSALTVDQFVEVYLRKRSYYRARSLYMLKLLAEHKEGLSSYLLPGELERLIAVGNEAEFKDLLITKEYEDYVYMAQGDTLREERVKNYSNLLSALNREGLIAQPLFRDFVAVYYDPKKTYARPINLTYTDLAISPESAALRKNSRATKSGLVPLGIYAIGDSVDRVLQFDFQSPERIRERKWTQYFTRLGQNLGTAFIPFPFSLLLRGTKTGVEFVLKKEGTDILVDTIRTEGELLALIDSGVVSLDPALIDQVKGEMDTSKNEALNTNIFNWIALNTDSGSKIHEYRAKNSFNMAQYLLKRPKALCKEIKALREGEFQSEFLTAGETWSRNVRSFFKFFGFSSDQEFAEERRDLILARNELLEARKVLNLYNPYIRLTTHERITAALTVVAQAKNPDDVDLFDELMKKFVDPDLLSATIKAATIHGNGNLVKPIATYLLKVNPGPKESIPFAVSEAIMALTKLDVLATDTPEETLEQALNSIEKLRASPNLRIRILANSAAAHLYKKLIEYRRS